MNVEGSLAGLNAEIRFDPDQGQYVALLKVYVELQSDAFEALRKDKEGWKVYKEMKKGLHCSSPLSLAMTYLFRGYFFP